MNQVLRQVGVHREQGARESMPHRTGLAGRAAAGNGDLGVELLGGAGHGGCRVATTRSDSIGK